MKTQSLGPHRLRGQHSDITYSQRFATMPNISSTFSGPWPSNNCELRHIKQAPLFPMCVLLIAQAGYTCNRKFDMVRDEITMFRNEIAMCASRACSNNHYRNPNTPKPSQLSHGWNWFRPGNLEQVLASSRLCNNAVSKQPKHWPKPSNYWPSSA